MPFLVQFCIYLCWPVSMCVCLCMLDIRYCHYLHIKQFINRSITQIHTCDIFVAFVFYLDDGCWVFAVTFLVHITVACKVA